MGICLALQHHAPGYRPAKGIILHRQGKNLAVVISTLHPFSSPREVHKSLAALDFTLLDHGSIEGHHYASSLVHVLCFELHSCRMVLKDRLSSSRWGWQPHSLRPKGNGNGGDLHDGWEIGLVEDCSRTVEREMVLMRLILYRLQHREAVLTMLDRGKQLGRTEITS
ncbi:hypothetical protein V6Z90_004860 [Aspergillus fumigatus]